MESSSNSRPKARGNIGRQSFESVSALVSGGKTPTEAFAIVAEQTGRSTGTVAAAYYRIARTIPGGAGVKQRARKIRVTKRTAPRAVGSRSRTTNGGADPTALTRQLVDAANALAEHVRDLERENREYRTIIRALDRLRLP